ncbi:MAG: hypothetical protein KC449_30370, partial [Anaerolineales bacterium]|nr:hypothetical protein [Anaerolineales bacterium]
LLRSALDLTGYEAAMLLADRAGGQGGRRYQNVQKFLGLARERGEADLAQFLRRLQLLKAREAREGEATAGEGDGGAVKLMSVHAAKGLEFPVVVVADLGRNSRPPRTERILHDPAFGLVCQRRDELGEWQKPAGFLWAEWLNEQMELAESKRLLYVACTRAADLLILSGRQSGGANWLNDICAAWEIEAEGDK